MRSKSKKTTAQSKPSKDQKPEPKEEYKSINTKSFFKNFKSLIQHYKKIDDDQAVKK